MSVARLPRNSVWQDAAACVGEDREAFYTPERVEEARATCARCPVREPCLAFTLALGERIGVWGGLDEEARHQLALRTHGTTARYQAGCHCADCSRAWADRRGLSSTLRRLLTERTVSP